MDYYNLFMVNYYKDNLRNRIIEVYYKTSFDDINHINSVGNLLLYDINIQILNPKLVESEHFHEFLKTHLKDYFETLKPKIEKWM